MFVGVAASYESGRESVDSLLAFETSDYLVCPMNVVATVRFCKHLLGDLRRTQIVTFDSRVRANSYVLNSYQIADVIEVVKSHHRWSPAHYSRP